MTTIYTVERAPGGAPARCWAPARIAPAAPDIADLDSAVRELDRLTAGVYDDISDLRVLAGLAFRHANRLAIVAGSINALADEREERGA